MEQIDIVGSDLRLVEHVTGRMTKGRAAAMGAASGAWFGLFIGLLVGLFTTGGAWLGLILGGILIGALWGAIFGFVGHAATGGQRDFSSTRSLAAARYDVIVRGGHADHARGILQREGLSGTA
ncbi:general stress protein [Streptomyces radiopugnans]|uniref:general stress protein n=1 Tax=Streptomyces radiopugnans TaxID=403935 RepID=UPI003F1ABFF4